MNKKVMYLLLLLTIVSVVGISQTVDYYNTYILRGELSYPLNKVEEELLLLRNVDPNNSNAVSVVTKIMLLFRRASFLDSEEKAREAYDFIASAYDSNVTFQIPVMLAYKGAVRSMIAGALTTLNPIPKINLLEEGKVLFDDALQSAKSSNNKDYLTLGYIYFLQGITYSEIPTFLELSKEAPTSLKKALSFYKKVKNISPVLIANVFYSYGIYYYKQGNIKVAVKNMKKAKKYAKNDVFFYTAIDNKLQEIKGE